MNRLDEEIQKILNESESGFNVGDIVYLWGDYGLYDTKYEIVEFTDTKDEKIKDMTRGYSTYKPNAETANPVVVLKDLEDSNLWAEEIKSRYGSNNIVLVSDVDAMNINSLDTAEMAKSLEEALSDKGINTSLRISMNSEKGKAFPKIKIAGLTNLVDQAGIFKYALKELEIESWGSGYVSIEKKTISFGLHFSYSHTRGGSNGCEIGDAIYNLVDKSWELKLGEY